MTEPIPEPIPEPNHPKSAKSNTDTSSGAIWNQVLTKAMSMPLVRVNRATFLRSVLSKYYPEEMVVKAIVTRPALAGIPASAIERLAKESIAWHRTGVSATSATLSATGGLTILASIPADLTQFIYHVIVVAQKLAYLHGWPDLFDESEKKPELDDATTHILTIFVAVMFGMDVAVRGLAELAKAASVQVVVRLPQMALTKTLVFQLSRETAKWVGLRLTKDLFSRALSRVVPVVSGIVGGTMTWAVFSTMARRLRLHLQEMALAKP